MGGKTSHHHHYETDAQIEERVRKAQEEEKRRYEMSQEKLREDNKKAYDQIIGDKPWRVTDMDWGEQLLDQLRSDVENYVPYECTVRKPRIVLTGAVGAGKSSYFNTIQSVMHGERKEMASSASSAHSHTRELRIYPVKDRENRNLNFYICDTMGIETVGEGITAGDIKDIMQGKIKDKYEFMSGHAIPEGHNKLREGTQDLDKQAQVVVIVVNAVSAYGEIGTETDDSAELWKSLGKVVKMARQIDVPVCILLSHIDEMEYMNPKLQYKTGQNGDLKLVYHSKQVQAVVQDIAKKISVAEYKIIPVVNFNTDDALDPDVSILALYTIRKILRLIDDRLMSLESVDSD